MQSFPSQNDKSFFSRPAGCTRVSGLTFSEIILYFKSNDYAEHE